MALPPSPHLPAGPHAPARPGVPGLVWQLCPCWDRASPPPEEVSRAISGCYVQPPSLSKMPRFLASCPPPPSWRLPDPRATSSVPRRCPSSPENLPPAQGCYCCLLGLSKPEGMSSMLWVPWEELWVPIPTGCPRRSQAVHGSGDNMVSTKWDGQK